MSTTTNPSAGQDQFSMWFIVVFVSFIVVAVSGVISISQGSSNGLVYTQLGLSFVGLLLSFIQAGGPGLLQKVIGRRVILERAISILLLILVLVLQFVGRNIPSPSPLPTDFSFTTITLKNGVGLSNVQPVSIPFAQLPLTITGRYSSPGSGQVWVVVRDNAGSYYLQQPQVEFRSGGQWITRNVDTNVGTTEIDFVSVTSLGQSIFSFMAQAKAFGGFAQLPDGSQVVQSISIQVTPPPTPIPPSTPAVTLHSYCQALVGNDFARALTYVSSSKVGTTVLSASELQQHVQADIGHAGSLRACSSTASDSVTSPSGTSYAGGSVIYSFRPGVWYFKSYSLFQNSPSSPWLIDTEYWKDPHAPGVY